MSSKIFFRIALFVGMFSVALRGIADPVYQYGLKPWQAAKVGDYMTMKIPGKFKIESIDLDAKTRESIDSLESYILDTPDDGEYQCLVFCEILNKGLMGDLDGAADGAVDNIKKDPSVSNVLVTKKYLTRFGMKGLFQDGTFEAQGKKAVFESLIFVKRNVCWTTMIIDTTDKGLPQISKAIFDSIQINFK